jgi:nitrate/nitrite-specific signal transduction histidine kinase
VRLSLPRSLTIRSRLLLYFVGIVALTAAAISSVTLVLVSHDARDRVVGQLQSVATLKQQEVDSWIGGLGLNLDIVLSGEDIPADLHTLTVAVSGSQAYDSAYSHALRRLTWASERMGLFEELFFMGPKGEVLLSTTRGHERQKLGMNDYFIQGMKREFIQEPSYSLSLQEMTVVASCPVTYRDVRIGVLAGRANLDSLNTLMIGRAGLGQTGETYLVGSNHRLLTALRRPGYSVPDTYVRTTGADAAVDDNVSGSATYQGYAGDIVIGVYRWIPRLQVALMAEQGAAEALHTTRLALWTTGGVAALAVVLAILAGTFLIHGIVRPLSELGDTAGRIAAGELDLTANVKREDEIGKLAQAFNRMTGQLRDLVRSLEKQTHHLRAINEAGRQISSILDLDELLPYVARSLLRTFDYESVRILLLAEHGSGRLYSCGRDACEEAAEVGLDDLDRLPAVASVAQSGEPLLRSSHAAAGETDDGRIPQTEVQDEPSEIAVPIRVGDNLAGVLDITSRGSHPLDEQDLFTARTLADQLAIAVENARLYQHAHELAASKERQRLARDLHDAVSQTLFSVSVIAEVLPRIYERDHEQGRQRLEELRQLTRGALAEMRTLLLELRPAALAEAELPDLLRQLGEAVMGRSLIPIDVQVDTSLEIPAEVRVALYRIAQEALNNVAKHSGADHGTVGLHDCGDNRRPALELVVEDDGSGFDPDVVRSGSLGLGIMTERADAIGARLQIESRPEEGTCVHVVWHPDASFITSQRSLPVAT